MSTDTRPVFFIYVLHRIEQNIPRSLTFSMKRQKTSPRSSAVTTFSTAFYSSYKRKTRSWPRLLHVFVSVSIRCQGGHDQCARALLEAKADPNTEIDKHVTSLNLACEDKHEEARRGNPHPEWQCGHCVNCGPQKRSRPSMERFRQPGTCASHRQHCVL